MNFNSLEFVVFAGLFFPAWHLLRPGTARLSLLVAASLFFYGSWDYRYVFLLVLSGVLDFVVGWYLGHATRGRRWWLACSLVGNLGILAWFKYAALIDDILAQWTWLLGGAGAVGGGGSLVPPVGLSFYTFQSMSYTIDIYRGRLKPTRSLVHFMAYLSMFPQLVAGPIVRAHDLLPQLERPPALSSAAVWTGWRWIATGFFKKMVLADNLAPGVEAAFGHPIGVASGAQWWLVAAMFAFQIYFDFSGYSDIACGLGRLMGVDFPRNFDHPYSAASMKEFWSRWHISLSTWFRDYVYIPLGGNRHGALREHTAMWIAMVLSGLWHGAAYTFLLWGALHALLLSAERLLRRSALGTRWRGPSWSTIPVVFGATLVTWVFFRAGRLTDATWIVGRMFDPEALTISPALTLADTTALVVALAWEVTAIARRRARGSEEFAEPHGLWMRAIPALLLVAAVYLRGPGQAFIYFRF